MTFSSQDNFHDDREKCLEHAVNFLERRQHSEVEIVRKLRQRGYSEKTVSATIDELKRLNLIDDLQFAMSLIREKLLYTSRPVGRRKIYQDLARRGVPRETISAAWREAEEEEFEQSEEERALRAARQKIKLIHDHRDLRKVREKLYRHLAGRGFDSESVRSAVERVLAGEAEE